MRKQLALIKQEVHRINVYMANINKSLNISSCEEEENQLAQDEDVVEQHLAELEAVEALEKEELTTSVEAVSDSNVRKPSDT